MNTYNRAQGMDNRLNMLFNQELDNESQYIQSHPFSSINMSLGGEVRFIAPIWPWNAPRFKSIDWRSQPPPRRIPGNTKHDQGKLFELPRTWNETSGSCWDETQVGELSSGEINSGPLQSVVKCGPFAGTAQIDASMMQA